MPSTIVNKLNCIKIKKATPQSPTTYNNALSTEINFDAIGLFFVRLTFLS